MVRRPELSHFCAMGRRAVIFFEATLHYPMDELTPEELVEILRATLDLIGPSFKTLNSAIHMMNDVIAEHQRRGLPLPACVIELQQLLGKVLRAEEMNEANAATLVQFLRGMASQN